MNKFYLMFLLFFLNIFFSMENKRYLKFVNILNTLGIETKNNVIKFSEGSIRNKDEKNKELIEKLIKNNKFLENLGYSFGFLNDPINMFFYVRLNNYFKKNNKNNKNSQENEVLLLGAGKGGFSEVSFCNNFKNITYNDSSSELLNSFNVRIKNSNNVFNTLIGNVFDLESKEKYNLICASNILHYYQNRYEYNFNYNSSDFILNVAPNLLKIDTINFKKTNNNFYNSKLFIIVKSIFCFNIKQEQLEMACNAIDTNLNKNEKNLFKKQISKEYIFKEFIIDIKKLMIKENLNWQEAKNEYFKNYEISEKLNNENYFTPVSLFPHDLFEKNYEKIKLLKNLYTKISIKIMSDSEYKFKNKIINLNLYENKFDELIFNLRENPLVVIFNNFKTEKEANDFLESLNLLDKYKKLNGFKNSKISDQKCFGMEIVLERKNLIDQSVEFIEKNLRESFFVDEYIDVITKN